MQHDPFLLARFWHSDEPTYAPRTFTEHIRIYYDGALGRHDDRDGNPRRSYEDVYLAG